jgi:hypothetical protein
VQETTPDTGLLSWQTRLNLRLAGIALTLFAAWHLAVAATTGVRGGDWQATLAALAHGHPLTRIPTGAGHLTAAAHPVLTTALFVVELLAMTAGFLLWQVRVAGPRRTRRAGSAGRPGFATETVVAGGLGLPRARAVAEYTRPGLSPATRQACPVEQVGLPLGTTTAGTPVILALEDHLLVLAPTGAGKTRDVMIPAALSAPGALVLTATRADALDVIHEHRTRAGRRVFVFDPADRLGWPTPAIWDPVAGCEHGATAIARALAFTAATETTDAGGDGGGFFRNNATMALRGLLHAAALDHRTMADVVAWALRLHDGAAQPVAIITGSTHPAAEHSWAPGLRSVATGAERTVASTRQTLAQLIEPVALRAVLDRLTPATGARHLDVEAFVRAGRDTLVLVADANSATNVAPLCAMLLQEVVDTAKHLAARSPGGRLDPPLRIVGDEIANIAPLPRLPELATDARGFGIQLVLALQSLPQAERRWGQAGARALVENMPAQLLLGGITEPTTLTRYSQLLGHIDTKTASEQFDPATGRPAATGTHTTQRPVMAPDALRTLPTGQAVLIHRNHPPVALHPAGWHTRPDAVELHAAAERSRRARTGSRAGHQDTGHHAGHQETV